MLKSLFGDPSSREARQAPADFAATAILETSSPEVQHDRGQQGDPHLHELVFTGSPAQAVRDHLAATPAHRGPGPHLIALHDPARMWAGTVVKALSDASGQPVERLQLREASSPAALATIEGTTLARRPNDALRICHADVPAGTPQAGDIAIALMEHAELACVIVGPLPAGAVDELLVSLAAAACSATWRCPSLLFLLPVGATALAAKVAAAPWPRMLQVQTSSEPLTSASTVWNTLLAHWDRVRPAATSTAVSGAPAGLGSGDFPIRVADIGREAPVAAPAAPPDVPQQVPPRVSPIPQPDPAQAATMVETLMQLDGMLYVLVAAASSGVLVAGVGPGFNLQEAAAAAAELLQTQRRILRRAGHPQPDDPVDEILSSIGGRYHVLRMLHAFPDHFVFAALDRLRTNLAMARFRLMESQQTLV